MVRVGAGAVAAQRGQRPGAALFGVFPRFDHHQPGALAHDETVAGLVEGPRGGSRFVVARGQRLEGVKSAERQRIDATLGTADQRDLGLAAADQAHAVADRLDAGRAGGDRATQRPLEMVLDRQVAAGKVGEEGRHGERRQAAHAARLEGFLRRGDGLESADAGGDYRGAGLLVVLALGEPAGLAHGLVGRRQRVKGEQVDLLAFLRLDDRVGVEAGLGVAVDAGHQARDPDRKIIGVEAVDRHDARLPFQQAAPNRLDTAPQRADHAHAGNNDGRLHLNFTGR